MIQGGLETSKLRGSIYYSTEFLGSGVFSWNFIIMLLVWWGL